MYEIEENTKDYRALISEREIGVPVFQQDWWLDILVGKENWCAFLIKKKELIIAIATIPISRKFKVGLSPMTQFQGLYFLKQDIDYSTQGKIIDLFSFKLKNCVRVKMSLNSNHNYILPYVWNGFDFALKNTYQLDTINLSYEQVFKNYKSSLKRNLKKAKVDQRIELITEYERDVYLLFISSFKRQSIKEPISESVFEKMITNGIVRKSLIVLGARNENNDLLGSIVLVFDKERMYYLGGGFNDNFKNNGTIAFMLDHGIQIAKEKGIVFDFEGSNIKSIENFFRSFGAKNIVYYKVIKYRYNWMKKLFFLLKGEL